MPSEFITWSCDIWRQMISTLIIAESIEMVITWRRILHASHHHYTSVIWQMILVNINNKTLLFCIIFHVPLHRCHRSRCRLFQSDNGLCQGTACNITMVVVHEVDSKHNSLVGAQFRRKWGDIRHGKSKLWLRPVWFFLFHCAPGNVRTVFPIRQPPTWALLTPVCKYHHACLNHRDWCHSLLYTLCMLSKLGELI